MTTVPGTVALTGLEGLSDVQRSFMMRTRHFLQAEVVPRIELAEQTRTFPTDLLPPLLRHGFVRAAIDPADGGSGLTHMECALLTEEAGRVWGSLRTMVNIQTLVAELLSDAGTMEQKRRFLDPLPGWGRIRPGSLLRSLRQDRMRQL